MSAPRAIGRPTRAVPTESPRTGTRARAGATRTPPENREEGRGGAKRGVSGEDDGGDSRRREDLLSSIDSSPGREEENALGTVLRTVRSRRGVIGSNAAFQRVVLEISGAAAHLEGELHAAWVDRRRGDANGLPGRGLEVALRDSAGGGARGQRSAAGRRSAVHSLRRPISRRARGTRGEKLRRRRLDSGNARRAYRLPGVVRLRGAGGVRGEEAEGPEQDLRGGGRGAVSARFAGRERAVQKKSARRG